MVRAYLQTFAPAGGAAQNEQLASHIRGAIRDGRFSGGTQLPPLREIAQLCGVNYFQVQKASEELVAEGLVYKVHGKGIFVREAAPRSGIVAILIAAGPDPSRRGVFPQMLSSSLSIHLGMLGFEPMTYFDVRPLEEQGRIPDTLARLIREKRLTGVIGIQTPPEAQKWFNKLDIPHVLVRRTRDDGRLFRPLAELLAGGRFQNPLLVITRDPRFPAGRDPMAASLRSAGIEPADFRQLHIVGGGADCEPFPDQCRRLLRTEFSAGNRPDLLLVYPDIALPGAVAAIYEAGIRIPDDMVLVAHRNVEIPVFCPFPVTYCDSSVEDFAVDTLKQLWLSPEPGDVV